MYQYPTCKVKYAETVITFLYSHKTEVDTGTHVQNNKLK